MACTPIRLGFELTSCNGIPDGLQSYVNSSVLECAALCLLNTCSSILFNDLRKTCFLNPNEIGPNTCPVFFQSGDVVVFNKIEDSRCPPTIGYSYDEVLDICFKFHGSTLPYLQAVAACKNEGGTGLLRVDSMELDAYLRTAGYGGKVDNIFAIREILFVSIPLYGKERMVENGARGFIEGRDEGTGWKYQDGTNLTYTNWYSGHPVTGSNCIMKAGATWSSVGCITSQTYCCEYA